MKRIVVFMVSVLMMIGVSALAHEGHEHGKSAGKTVTLTGEVIDMTCFLQHPESATGADHAKCAKSCIKQGNPVGFLADNGTVYVLIGDDHTPVALRVVEHAGVKSTITGVVVEHHGVKGIEMASISAAVAKTRPGAAAKPAADSAVTYTCPMHPEIHMTQPGECPKCGMTLVPEKKK
jgi:Heavy metal binding domain